ncbi:unnamed protein product [Clavelina lepadiformis]|uniref:Uncharacterized protein n=2 Tax=Clavelina lepadiformis TaxID=159417 RepID=A0ABP0EW20_CLALP
MRDQNGTSSIHKRPNGYVKHRYDDDDDVMCSLNGKQPRNDSRIGHQLNSVYGTKYDQWLRSFQLRPCWEVHKDTVEVHIWHGYRPNPSSLSYCLKSAFYPSNETLNAWTHFIPFLLFCFRIYNVYCSLEYQTDDVTYPFWIFSIGCCFVFLVSTLAHLFNCYSATAQEFCYCLDYGGISVFGLSSAICIHYYMCSYRCFGFETDHLSLPAYPYVMSLLGIFATYVTCQSRFPFCRLRYLCRFGPTAICHTICTVPCINRVIMTQHPSLLEGLNFASTDHEVCHLGDNYLHSFFFQTCSYVAAIGFVATRFPEKWFPGTFDIVGHSHQWFHIFTALGMYYQHLMAEDSLRHALALIEAGELEENVLGINEWSTVIPMFLFITAVLFIVYSTASKVGSLVHKNRKENLSFEH